VVYRCRTKNFGTEEFDWHARTIGLVSISRIPLKSGFWFFGFGHGGGRGTGAGVPVANAIADTASGGPRLIVWTISSLLVGEPQRAPWRVRSRWKR